ncbi:protein kinase [Pendulispora brunnea]|uniref:Protein kinase n=1 Tax=Pendulispora brunnea TaxID=2905690 RepID=A0ABZ2JZU9_9BACT
MSSLDPFRMIGKTLAGHFLVQSLVGEGRSSIVYKGLHIGPKKPVALKCYKLGSWLDAARAETFLKRFREESKAASQIGKENAAFVRGIGSGMTTSDEGVYIPYTVLEWLEGHSLAREVAERSQSGRPLTELLVRFEPAAKALAQAHEQKLVHGDLTLGSFFLVKSGGESPTKILDLGVAKVIRDLAREIAPGEAPQLIASPSHAAPEQFDPKLGDWGPPTDVYALALVLIEVMRGKEIPSTGEEKDFAAIALDPKKRPTPRSFGISVFDAVENAFAKAVALAPSERWSSVSEFWSELESAVRSEEPTRRVLPAEVLAEEESEEIEVPSTEPRPAVKPATDDTSPNGVLIDATGLAPSVPAAAPPPQTAAPAVAAPPERVSALPVPPPVAPVAAPAKSIPAPTRSSPSAAAGLVGVSKSTAPAASGSGGLFKIPPPTPTLSPSPKKLSEAGRITPAPPQPGDVAATGRASQPHAIPRPVVARSFPSTPAKPRSDLPPQPSKLATVTVPPVLTPLVSGTPATTGTPATSGRKPEPVEVRRDTPTMPIEPVSDVPRISPVERDAAPQAGPGAMEIKATPPPPPPEKVENGTDARVVREMVPPPKANVSVGDLPSVMVDEPEPRKDKDTRQRETVRIAMPNATQPNATSPVPWEAASANNALVAPTKEDSDSVVYPPRTVRRRRGLWGVALVSFLVVFVLGAIFIGLWHYSTELP